MIKCARQKNERRRRLEAHMNKTGYSQEKKKMIMNLFQEMESNFVRLWVDVANLFQKSKMTISMFEFVFMLGNGGYGNVFLVRKKDTRNIYAMKIISKKKTLTKKQIRNIKAERDILSEADSVWIVKLYYSFQDKKSLYFILEYLPGGDLMTLLIQKGVFSEHWARFYISELVVAIEYVHSLKFCHRDIKPDNILISADGHIKLCDFGLSTGGQPGEDKQNHTEGTFKSHFRKKI
ncbi:serine/threonine-protein kinase 38-like [Octopus sinensis]|uniref:non-specific serine/threonine protein kinase n=1 Tax=Octopus sinensis TaxID=2607531 RepID=A0A7E6EMV0_9MOLL|nr:serine/threonine-protein kinase 38-like [Octopus sinensis]